MRLYFAVTKDHEVTARSHTRLLCQTRLQLTCFLKTLLNRGTSPILHIMISLLVKGKTSQSVKEKKQPSVSVALEGALFSLTKKP